MKPETPRKFTIDAKVGTTSTNPQNSASIPSSASDFTMESKRLVP
jgi:hypothetical protein